MKVTLSNQHVHLDMYSQKRKTHTCIFMNLILYVKSASKFHSTEDQICLNLYGVKNDDDNRCQLGVVFIICCGHHEPQKRPAPSRHGRIMSLNSTFGHSHVSVGLRLGDLEGHGITIMFSF